MRVHIVYDSSFGNTEIVARRIGQVLGRDHDVILRRVGQVQPGEVAVGDVLIVGSPTQAGRATPDMAAFVANLPDAMLEGLRFAAFDTRLRTRWVRVFGYAADRMAHSLRVRDGVPLAPAEGFFVAGKKGPLEPDELDRAGDWAAALAVPAAH